MTVSGSGVVADRDVSPAAEAGAGANGHEWAAEPVLECYHRSLGAFAAWLLAVYRRSTRGPTRVFCPQWWKHPEAVARIDALWRAFEALRQDPGTGMSVFWRDHVDHHMTVLLDADGPFKGCQDGHCDHPLAPLHQDRPPAELFDRDSRGLPPSATARDHPRPVAQRTPSGSSHQPQSAPKPARER